VFCWFSPDGFTEFRNSIKNLLARAGKLPNFGIRFKKVVRVSFGLESGFRRGILTA
jgi:hypothetical protein